MARRRALVAVASSCLLVIVGCPLAVGHFVVENSIVGAVSSPIYGYDLAANLAGSERGQTPEPAKPPDEDGAPDSKTVEGAGKTVRYVKVTVAPDGSIVSDKLNP